MMHSRALIAEIQVALQAELEAWNDEPGRTQEEVLRALRGT